MKVNDRVLWKQHGHCIERGKLLEKQVMWFTCLRKGFPKSWPIFTRNWPNDVSILNSDKWHLVVIFPHLGEGYQNKTEIQNSLHQVRRGDIRSCSGPNIKLIRQAGVNAQVLWEVFLINRCFLLGIEVACTLSGDVDQHRIDSYSVTCFAWLTFVFRRNM